LQLSRFIAPLKRAAKGAIREMHGLISIRAPRLAYITAIVLAKCKDFIFHGYGPLFKTFLERFVGFSLVSVAILLISTLFQLHNH
jgi:hypothetical protein